MPALSDALNHVASLPVKYERAASKTSTLSRLDEPVLNKHALFLLPMKLLDKCINVLPVKNNAKTSIVLAHLRDFDQMRG